MNFNRGDRTYHVSDERLQEFAKLSAAQKLAWVEQCSQFIRLARAGQTTKAPSLAPGADPFAADRVDHKAGMPVFNKITGMKDSFGK